jgi:hypothetical protein
MIDTAGDLVRTDCIENNALPSNGLTVPLLLPVFVTAGRFLPCRCRAAMAFVTASLRGIDFGSEKAVLLSSRQSNYETYHR